MPYSDYYNGYEITDIYTGMDSMDTPDNTSDIMRRLIAQAQLTLGDLRGESEDEGLLLLMEQACETTLRRLDFVDSLDADETQFDWFTILSAFFAGVAWGRVSHQSDLNETILEVHQLRDRLIERRRRTM